MLWWCNECEHVGFVAKSGLLCNRLCFVADKHLTRNELSMRHDDLDRKS